MYFCAHLNIRNVPAAINSKPTPILFATANPGLIYFQNFTNVFAKLNERFEANKLALNSDKEKCIKCYAKKTCLLLNTDFDNKLIEEVESKKFLGQQFDNNLN
jgi:hypothetical protein